MSFVKSGDPDILSNRPSAFDLQCVTCCRIDRRGRYLCDTCDQVEKENQAQDNQDLGFAAGVNACAEFLRCSAMMFEFEVWGRERGELLRLMAAELVANNAAGILARVEVPK